MTPQSDAVSYHREGVLLLLLSLACIVGGGGSSTVVSYETRDNIKLENKIWRLG